MVELGLWRGFGGWGFGLGVVFGFRGLDLKGVALGQAVKTHVNSMRKSWACFAQAASELFACSHGSKSVLPRWT